MSDLPKDTTTQKGAPATNSSEFAEKQPLVTQTSLRKWGLIISGFVGFLVILGASIFAFSNIINRVPQIINEPIDEPAQVVDEINSLPKFAYIKNNKSAWITDIEVKDKIKMVELQISSKNEILGLRWKDVTLTVGYVPNVSVDGMATYSTLFAYASMRF